MTKPKNQSSPKTATVKPVQAKVPFHFAGRKFNIILILSVIGLCFLLYGNAIPNGFSLDDEFVVHNDSIVAKGISGIPELFKSRYAWDQKGSYGYRPISKISFAIEYSLFKDSPQWGHFINILLYAFICIFFFYFFRKLFYNQFGDYFLLIALAIFITHPIHSEVVVSLKNRDEMLVFIFGFYCCYAIIKWFEEEKMLPRVLWGLSGCLSLGLGYLCKPDALIFIPITVLILYFFSAKGMRAAVTSFLLMSSFLIMGSGFIHKHVLPHANYHRTYTFIENPLFGVHWYHKFPLAFSTIWFYITKMLFPKDLVCYYGYDAFDAFPAWTDFAVLAGILLACVLVYLIIKNLKKKSAILFLLLLFVGTALPYTDLFQVGPGLVAERFMFIPSVSFIFLIIYLLFYILKQPVDKQPFGQRATYMYAFTIAVCIIFTARVIVRNPDWKSHESIYMHDAGVSPRSAKLQSLLGSTYIADAKALSMSDPQQKAEIDTLYLRGQAAYEQAVLIYPGYATSWNNLGMIEYTLYGNAHKAIHNFSNALKIDSDYTEAWFNMGACYEAMSYKAVDTLKSFRRDSISLNENKAYGRETKEALNGAIKACKSRIEFYKRASETCYLRTINLSPTYYIAYAYIARLYSSEGQYHKIVEVDSNALKNGYQSNPIYVTLGNAYLLMKDTVNTIVNYEKSVPFYRKNLYILNFLEEYYYKKGDTEKANYYKQIQDHAAGNKN
jgi:protein O-mannosyl-transferase